MQINGLMTIALAGFAAVASAQPHKHHLHVRHPGMKHDTLMDYVTTTAEKPVEPTLSPREDKVRNTSKFKLVPTASAPPAPRKTVKADVKKANGQKKAISSGSGLDRDFPDGEISCDEFPSEYGAIKTDWITKAGWSSIQKNGGNDDHIGVCTDGALCNYACPAGYSKAQWPEVQPASGESMGGLKCKNGKLYKTQGSYNKLCRAGKGTAKVVNKLDKHVAICRTDYPGSENMVVPLSCAPDSKQELTVPEASNSYVWQGKSSSAQYYVNNAGISTEDGCRWGTPNGGLGNWSPVVIGAGYSDGKTWLSISQNNLNSDPLNYNIRIVAEDGSKINGDCCYENGKITNGDPVGCTVAVENGGSARFELY